MRITLLTLSLFVAACPGDGKPNSETTAGETTAATGGSETTAPTTTATTTPDEPPPTGMCRTNADCMNVEFDCVPPGSGGGCPGPTGCILEGEPCVDDAGCGGSPDAPQICVADSCCGDRFCQPGCVGPDSCGPLGMCGPDARCVPRKCDAGDPCPANFSCTADTCAPTPCESDAQCDGVCLLGYCSTGFGVCEEQAS